MLYVCEKKTINEIMKKVLKNISKSFEKVAANIKNTLMVFSVAETL